MSKNLRSILLLMIFLLPACARAGTPAPTAVPPVVKAIASVTSTSIPTVTPQPSATLQQAGALYAGPGNADFEQVASLKAGAAVLPIATFGDFVEVATSVDSQELHGYVWKNILAALPAGISRQLSIFPWRKQCRKISDPSSCS